MSFKNRYVVIAEYPDSPYKIGEVIYDESYPVNKLSFPKIFKPLVWCEDLIEDDLQYLPEYIMIDPLVEIEPPFVVFKIIKWDLENGKLVATNHKKEKMSLNSLRLYLPSNKIEFAKYIREWNQFIKKYGW